MKETPITFSPHEIRALISCKKKQIRKPMLPWPKKGFTPSLKNTECPFGTKHDRLWTQEEYGIYTSPSGAGYRCGIDYPADEGGKYIAEWQCHTKEWIRIAEGFQNLSEFDTIIKEFSPDDRFAASKMPRWASRQVVEVLDIRLERLQDISPEDALAEGFDRETCGKVFHQASDGRAASDAYSIHRGSGITLDGWYCEFCTKKLGKPNDEVDCGCTPETDGPAQCENCHNPLLVSLSQSGIESQLGLTENPNEFKRWFPCHNTDATINFLICEGIGDFNEKKHLGRMAQIGFATHWEMFNTDRKSRWAINPWVWVISIKT